MYQISNDRKGKGSIKSIITSMHVKIQNSNAFTILLICMKDHTKDKLIEMDKKNRFYMSIQKTLSHKSRRY
jgi:predicted type IV restriction endonuclease